MKDFDTLLAISTRKAKIDANNDWYNGSETYLSEIKNEVDEVIEEIPKQRKCYLEDELGDVLWGYLNTLLALEKEAGISASSVLRRACAKYEERISGIESCERWRDIKERQKAALVVEYEKALETCSEQ